MKNQYIYGKEKTCPVCGNPFRGRDADSPSYQSKYCSHGCRNKSRRKHHPKKCGNCEKVFIPRREGHNFCSKTCSGEHKSRTHKPTNEAKINKKLAAFSCGLIHRCLRSKSDTTAAMLGYEKKELRDHLESHFKPGMSWENYGKGEGNWSIDHTRPISTFDKSTTISEINALENLRPMWHSENCSKKNKWEGR